MSTILAADKKKPGSGSGRSAGPSRIRENQIFVRNLSFDVTEEHLVAAFEDIGPVKHAAVTVDPATKKSKGFGFITFSLPEDAALAVNKMNGKFLKGRDMKLELAIRKGKDENDDKRGGKGESDNRAAVNNNNNNNNNNNSSSSSSSSSSSNGNVSSSGKSITSYPAISGVMVTTGLHTQAVFDEFTEFLPDLIKSAVHK